MLEFLSQRLRRRDALRGSALGLLTGLAPEEAAAAPTAGLQLGGGIYESIGVQPLINARGTFTIISGSTMLPEVRSAMAEASQRYVHIDELMAAVGARLAELTQAEWGMVSCGCSAAITHATAACIAGGNADLHVRLPNLEGFAKDEVLIPNHSRNVYDAAVRAVGAKVVEAGTVEEFAAALGPRTAMVYILAGPNADKSPLPTRVICEMAKKHNVPVFVDAAAEGLTVPNVHLQAGADLVAYSGGKCMRGPQTAGLLLGRKDLVQAAWVHSSPHHGFARGLKIGKEEAVGMLMAVEMWRKRDHKAEWNGWMARLDHIAKQVSAVPGVTTSIRQPEGLSNNTPTLIIQWDAAKTGVTGRALARHLFTTAPRIALPTGASENSIQVVPYMMAPGDEKVVADRIAATLKNPPPAPPATNAPAAADLSGRWDVEIEYSASKSTHVLHLKQTNGQIEGTHQGEFVSRDLMGQMEGNRVRLTSSYSERHGDSLQFEFTGQLSGDRITGTLSMGEYLDAKWVARRHVARGRRG
jgi:L-seryl-tRNA(Ser) seleniumtransferase